MNASQSARRQYEREMTFGKLTLPRSEYGLLLDHLKEISSLTEVCACIEHTRGMNAADEMAYLRQRIELHEARLDPAKVERETVEQDDEYTAQDYEWSREPLGGW